MRNKFIIRTFFFFVVFFLISSVSLAGVDRYLDPAGVDAGNCGAVETACNTVAYALTQSGGGDVIHLAPGVYNYDHQVVIDKSITISGANRNNTFINITGTHGFQVVNPIGPVPVVIENVSINATGEVCAILNSSSYLIVQNTAIKSTSRGIFLSNGESVIKNNIIYATGLEGVLVNPQEPASETKYIIQGNTFGGTRQGVAVQNANINSIGTIANNIFGAIKEIAINVTAQQQNKGKIFFHSILIYNNNFFGSRGPAYEPDAGILYFHNNLVAYNSPGMLFAQNRVQVGKQFRSYNLLFNNTAPLDLPAPQIIAGDPKFVFADFGTSTDRTDSVLSDTTKDWPVNSLAGKFVAPNFVPGTKQIWYYILSNTSNTLTVANGDMTAWANPGDPYKIFDGKSVALDSATVNAGDPDLWDDADESRADIGVKGGPATLVPFVTQKTPMHNWVRTLSPNKVVGDILINNPRSIAIAEYEWTQVQGPATALNSNTVKIPVMTMTPDQATVLAYNVKVTDANGQHFQTKFPVAVFVNDPVKLNSGPVYNDFAAAYAAAVDGDLIEFGNGIYRVFEPIAKNIVLRGKGRKNTVIDGLGCQSILGSGPQKAGLHITADSNVSIRDLTIRYVAAGPGIYFDAGPAKLNMTVDNVVLEHNSKDGLLGTTKGLVTVSRSRFIGNGDDGIDARGDEGILIHKSDIQGNHNKAITYSPGEAPKFVKVISNVIANNLSTGLEGRFLSNFENNIVVNPTSLTTIAHPDTNLSVRNNTFFSMEESPSFTATPGTKVYFGNNIVMASTDDVRLRCSAAGDFIIDHNLYNDTNADLALTCDAAGDHEKINTAPLFVKVLQDTIDDVSDAKITVVGAGWTPNEFAGSFFIARGIAFLIIQNTETQLTFATARDQPTLTVPAYGISPEDPFIITKFKFTKASPLFDGGYSDGQYFPPNDIGGVSRLSFAASDIGVFEIPEYTLNKIDLAKNFDIEEGKFKKFPVSLLNELQKEQTATVTITPQAGVTVVPTTLTFTADNWKIPQNITVTVPDDTKKQGDRFRDVNFKITSTDFNYNNVTPEALRVKVKDNEKDIEPIVETYRVILRQTEGSTTVSKSGLQDKYTIVLSKQPGAIVDMNLEPSAHLGVTPATISFTTTNWNVPQQIAVRALKMPSSLNSTDPLPDLPEHYIIHKLESADANYNDLKPPPILAVVMQEANGAHSGDSVADAFTLTVHNGDVVERKQDRVLGVITGKLYDPEIMLTQIAGPSLTIGEQSVDSNGTRLKVFYDITAPKYNPKNNKVVLELSVTDQSVTKTENIILNILPVEKELTAQNTRKVDGQVLAVSGNGTPIKKTEKDTLNGSECSVSLTTTKKVVFKDLCQPQVVTVGDEIVIVSDFSYRTFTGAVLAFHLPSLTQTSYDFYDAVSRDHVGVTKLVGTASFDMLGFRMKAGDSDGNGTEEVWILSPNDDRAAVIIVANARTLIPVKYYYEADSNVFSTLFNVADINGDGLFDFIPATVLTSGTRLVADDVDDYRQYQAADKIDTYLASPDQGSKNNLNDILPNQIIQPMSRTDLMQTPSLKMKFATTGPDAVITLTEALDMNNDGADDIATASSDLVVSVAFGEEELGDTMEAVDVDLSSIVDAIFSMASGDVTGDGIDDLVLGCNDGIIIIIPGNVSLPDGTITVDDLIVMYLEDISDVETLIVGDMNGDGVADIATTNSGGTITTVIDTFNGFNGENEGDAPETTEMKFSGGSAACSANVYTTQSRHLYTDMLTIIFLALCLALFRLHRSQREKQ